MSIARADATALTKGEYCVVHVMCAVLNNQTKSMAMHLTGRACAWRPRNRSSSYMCRVTSSLDRRTVTDGLKHFTRPLERDEISSDKA